MKKVLFVCTGNICRSPMAEGIFNDCVKKAKKDGVYKGWSAGVYAEVYRGATLESVRALEERGIDINAHRAQSVTYENVEGSDLIIAMTRSHKHEILRRFPEAKGKVFTLYEYTEGDLARDIEDPYGMHYKVYKDCADEIGNLVEKTFQKLDND